MIISLFHTIGVRLIAVLVIMVIGFVTIGVSATVFFGQMERAYGKRQTLFEQEQHLDSLRSSILTSVVLLDNILFKGDTSAIPILLSFNEDTLSSFASFQASAEKNELFNDIYLATEYEPVVYRLRKDFYNAISLFRKGNVEAAKAAREDVLAKRLKIVNAFIDNSHALREFEIIDQNKVIVSLREKIVKWGLGIFVLTTSVCFLVQLFTGRSITKPVTTLKRAMERFTPENYENGIPLDVGGLGNNEIGVLGRIFEEMTSNIRTYITERKRVQAQVIQASKLATLGEMSTSVAHELNQPLNIIRMAAGNVRRKISKGTSDPEYLDQKMERIQFQTERAAAIIDHMRMFGRKTEGADEKLDLKKMITNVLDLMGEQLRLLGIEVITEFPDKCLSIKGNMIQMEQVVLNLLSNSRDAIEEHDGEKKIILRVVEENGGIQIITEDTGGGIPEDVIPRIFEPFYTTKEMGKGTGLGLSMSYGIIVEMGGTIDVENAGGGAKFTITLPAAEKDAGNGRSDAT